MTQSEFIKMYIKNTGISEDELNELGLFAVPCDCGEDSCKGWGMISRENLKDHVALYVNLTK